MIIKTNGIDRTFFSRIFVTFCFSDDIIIAKYFSVQTILHLYFPRDRTKKKNVITHDTVSFKIRYKITVQTIYNETTVRIQL